MTAHRARRIVAALAASRGRPAPPCRCDPCRALADALEAHTAALIDGTADRASLTRLRCAAALADVRHHLSTPWEAVAAARRDEAAGLDLDAEAVVAHLKGSAE